MKMNVVKIIGEYAITIEDGTKIYRLVFSELISGKEVELDFEGVEIFASPFFNAAIGQLLQDIEPAELNKLLSFTNLSQFGRKILRRVIANAKEYYSQKGTTQAAIDQAIQDGLTE